MAKTDPMVAETQRVYAEYDEARVAWEANRTDPFAKARFDRAQDAVHATRRTWREIGHVTGNRDVLQVPKVVDNTDAPAPTLIPQEA